MKPLHCWIFCCVCTCKLEPVEGGIQPLFQASLLFALCTTVCDSPALVYIPGGWPLQDVSRLLSASQIALISLLIDKFLFLPSLSLPSFPTFLSFSSFLPFFFPLAAFSPSETGGWQEGRSQVLIIFPLWYWLCLFLGSSFQWTSPVQFQL